VFLKIYLAPVITAQPYKSHSPARHYSHVSLIFFLLLMSFTFNLCFKLHTINSILASGHEGDAQTKQQISAVAARLRESLPAQHIEYMWQQSDAVRRTSVTFQNVNVDECRLIDFHNDRLYSATSY
jgi:hypothetical protein